MPSKEIKKEAIHSILEQSPLDARHYPGLQKITRGFLAAIARKPNPRPFSNGSTRASISSTG
jgi:hypothetical protein